MTDIDEKQYRDIISVADAKVNEIISSKVPGAGITSGMDGLRLWTKRLMIRGK